MTTYEFWEFEYDAREDVYYYEGHSVMTHDPGHNIRPNWIANLDYARIRRGTPTRYTLSSIVIRHM